MSRNRILTLSTTSVLALSLASAAFASEAASGAAVAATPESATVLPELVVTAQRRVEDLQKVAIAATVFSADTLKKKGVTRVDDLQFASPSLSVTPTGSVSNVNIRGIGLASSSANSANGVATYIDGLFQPPIVTTNNFFDIANVEVLRGPQGTLVGSNSTGGAILITSQSPRLAGYGGYAEVGGGSFGAYGGEGAVNLPVTDTLAFRVAAIARKRESYFSQAGGPSAYDRAGSLDEKGVRLGLLWKPNDRFQVLSRAEVVGQDTGGFAYKPIPGTLYAPFATPGAFRLDYDSPVQNSERARLFSTELRYELPSAITVRSLSGYQSKQLHNRLDMDGTSRNSPSPIATANFPQQTQDQNIQEREWTEELNIISPTTGRLSWILGAYYQKNIIDAHILQITSGPGQLPVNINIRVNKQTTGYFGQIGYHIAPDFELDVGLRYSAYRVGGPSNVVVGKGVISPTGIQVADIGGDEADHAVTGKVALNWTPNANNLLYVFASRGYKAGGFNGPGQNFAPETVWDYEAGWKSTLLDGHLRTQLGGFYNDFNHYQTDVLNGMSGQTGVANVSDAKIYGVEAQAQAKLGGWTLDGGLAMIKSELGSITFINSRNLPPGTTGGQCAPGQPVNQNQSLPNVCFDYRPYTVTRSGEPTLYAPELTYNVGVEYTFELPEASSLTPRLNYAYVGEQWANLSENPVTDRLPGRGLLSAQLTWKRGPLSLEAYGTNLTNKVYVSGQTGNNEFLGAPREYGLKLHYEF